MQLNDIKTLSFDCYGTLIDWETGIYNALTRLLNNHAIDREREDLLQTYAWFESEIEKGTYKPYREILQEVVNCFGKEYGFIPSAEEKESLPESLPEWLPFPDTVEALGLLKQRFKLAIISNIDDDLFALTNRYLQIEFDWIVTAGQVKAYKPDLEVFRHAMNIMEIDPKQHLHVAQSLYHDIAPAKSLGLQTVWVNRRKGMAGSGATPQAHAEPDLEVRSLTELARL